MSPKESVSVLLYILSGQQTRAQSHRKSSSPLERGARPHARLSVCYGLPPARRSEGGSLHRWGGPSQENGFLPKSSVFSFGGSWGAGLGAKGGNGWRGDVLELQQPLWGFDGMDTGVLGHRHGMERWVGGRRGRRNHAGAV